MISKEKEAERRKFWQEVIGEQRRSGKTARAFCQQRGVGEHSFYMWRQRLERPKKPLRFALVQSSSEGQAAREGLELALTSGERLRIPAGADAATLRVVLEVLRETRA
jgi:hypothetical protein